MSDTTASPSAMRVVRERWWIILLTTVLGLLGGIAVAVTSSKSYSATSKVLIQPSSPISSVVVQSATSTEDPTRVAATDLLLITSNTVAQAAAQSLGPKVSPSDVLSDVSASEEPNADLFDITATSEDPALAAGIANAVATQFVAYLQGIEHRSALSAEADLRRRLPLLPAGDRADATQIDAALQRVYELEASQSSGATVVDTASAPANPTSPNRKIDVALGVVFGLGFGLGLAFLVDLTDRRIKDDAGLESAYGIRTLVHVPTRLLAPSASQPGSPAFEPYRILATTLTYSHAAKGMRSLLITSAFPHEGKTAVAVGLARALANSGRTVCLVDLDLRGQGVRGYFDLSGRTGLATALIGDQPISDVLQHPYPDMPNLTVLPSGPRVSTSPIELSHRPEFDRVIAELLETSEVLILDAPPVLGIADAQALLDHPRIDATLLVARANRTSPPEAKRTREILDHHLVRPLGLVVTGMNEPGADAYYQYIGARSNGRSRRAGRRRHAEDRFAASTREVRD